MNAIAAIFEVIGVLVSAGAFTYLTMIIVDVLIRPHVGDLIIDLTKEKPTARLETEYDLNKLIKRKRINLDVKVLDWAEVGDEDTNT